MLHCFGNPLSIKDFTVHNSESFIVHSLILSKSIITESFNILIKFMNSPGVLKSVESLLSIGNLLNASAKILSLPGIC